MQPFTRAKGLRPRELGTPHPALALQVSDGENGGVMMNEFPGHYRRVWDEVDAEGVVGMNGDIWSDWRRRASRKRTSSRSSRSISILAASRR
jgi:hypothetical protein